MKKVLSVLLAVVLCASMACSAVAAPFVPSISYKNNDLLISFDDGNGGKAFGKLTDAEGNETYVYDCLLLTTVAEALDESVNVPADIREELIDVYEELKEGDMKLPYKKVNKNLKADEVVIRELVDISFICNEHKDSLKGENTTITLLIDLGVEADDTVYVMAYVDEEWETAVEVINNGDGTITLVLEELCPIAFSVVEDEEVVETRRFIKRVIAWIKDMIAKFN